MDVKAKVVINERTGTAVIGKDVKFQQLALFKRENADQVYTSLFDEKVADLFLSEQKWKKDDKKKKGGKVELWR